MFVYAVISWTVWIKTGLASDVSEIIGGIMIYKRMVSARTELLHNMERDVLKYDSLIDLDRKQLLDSVSFRQIFGYRDLSDEKLQAGQTHYYFYNSWESSNKVLNVHLSFQVDG